MSAAASAFWLWPSSDRPLVAEDAVPFVAPTRSGPVERSLSTRTGSVIYAEWTFAPPWRVIAEGPPPDLSSPEAAILAYALAVRAGAWETAQALLDPESRAARQAAGAARGVTGAERAALWKQHFGEQVLIATHLATARIDAREVAFVALAREGASEQELRSSPALAVVRGADGRWWVTDAFRAHPLTHALGKPVGS